MSFRTGLDPIFTPNSSAMEHNNKLSEARYLYSDPVVVENYQSPPRDDIPSKFKPRVSRFSELADKACSELIADFRRGDHGSVQASLIKPATKNLVAFWMPETLPDRLEIISYMFEYLFVEDGRSIYATLLVI